MARERFLINPVKRKKRKTTTRKKTSARKKTSRRKNSVTLADVKRVVGEAVKGSEKVAVNRKRKRKTTSKRKKSTYKRRKNAQKKARTITRTKKVIVYRTKPKKRRKRRYKRRNPVAAIGGNRPKRTYRKRRVSRKRKSYRRRNAPQTMIKTLQKQIPFFVSGGLGATVVTLVPSMLNIVNPWAKRGVQLAIAIGGASFAAQTMRSKQHGTAFAIGGGSVVIFDLIKEFVFPMLGLEQFADYELDDYELDAYPGAELDDDMYDEYDDEYDDMGDYELDDVFEEDEGMFGAYVMD